VTLAGMKLEEIGHVLLVGGVTRMPIIQDRLARLFGAEKLRRPPDPDALVAKGAAILACDETHRSLQISDVLPRSLRRRVPMTTHTRVIISRGTRIQDAQGTLSFNWPKSSKKETSVAMDLCEGNEEDFTGNVPLATLTLSPGPSGMAAGTPVQVAIEYNAEASRFEATARAAQGGNISAEMGPFCDINLASIAPDLVPTRLVDIVVCMDVSRSFRMGLLSRAVEQCLAFEARLRQTRAECRFGLLAFADPSVPGEDIREYALSTTSGALRGWLSDLPEYDGGDTPEDIPAVLRQALAVIQSARPEATKAVLLFTDGPPRDPEALVDLRGRLRGSGTAVFLYAPQNLPAGVYQLYERLAVDTGGMYLDVHTALCDDLVGVLRHMGLVGSVGGGRP
jgi:hypothetical protein